MKDGPTAGAIDAGVHRIGFRVYYEDTDAAGLVYHARYLGFAERGRTEMLRCLGIEQQALAADAGLVFAVRRLLIDYLQPARLDDAVTVLTRVAALGGASVSLDQEIRRDAVILARLAVKVAMIDGDGRPNRLPPELRRLFTAIIPVQRSGRIEP